MRNPATFSHAQLLLVLFVFLPTNSLAEFRSRNAGFEVLTFAVPAFANGMGGASVASSGSGSELFNPAALSIYHFDHSVRFRSPSATQWAPDVGPSIALKTWGASAGKHIFGANATRNSAELLLSIGYTHTELDLGLTKYVDTDNTVFGTAQVSEESDAVAFSVGFGIRDRIRFGLGLTIKRLNETLSDFLAEKFSRFLSKRKNYAHDWGVFVRVPLINRRNTSTSNHLGSLGFTVAFVRANLGSEISTLNSKYYIDSLPRIERIGSAINGSFRFNRWFDLSGKLAFERETDLVGNLLPIERRGAEIGLNDALFFRIGKFNRGFEDSDISTWGAGFKLRGLLDWILGAHATNSDTKNNAESFARRIDMTIDYARYSGDILSGTEFLQTTISF